MKTRNLIIILSVFAIFFVISVMFGYDQDFQSTNSDENHLSSLLDGDSLCFNSFDKDRGEMCYSLNELGTYKCSIPILERLAQHSNWLDADFTEVFYINLPSLPNNISEKDYDACIEFLKSVRLPLNQENEN